MLSQPYLLSLPSELIERILLFCRAQDVSKVAQTCHVAHNLIYNSHSQYLWRELFLAHPFDDTRNAVIPGREPLTQVDWKFELQRRIEAQLVAQSFSPLTLLGPKVSFDRLVETFISAIETATPMPEHPTPETAHSANLCWVERVLKTSVFLITDSLCSSDAYRQSQARLRAYLSLCVEDPVSEERRRYMNNARRNSRSFVYNLSKYTAATLWGPYHPVADEKDLTVNWTHVEHIVNVVAMKLRKLNPLARYVFRPPFRGLSAIRTYSDALAFQRPSYDWAGVTGKWRRMVCFMDYRDLFEFNFSSSHSGPRNPSFFNDDYEEVLRPVEVSLEAIEPEEKSNVQYPVLYFRGSAHGSHIAEAAVEGSVRLLVDGQLRWHFTTRYDGLTQWSVEGVQLGGLCSMAGVAGIWTGAFHEEGDPTGPFWMWKLHDELNLSGSIFDSIYYDQS